MNGSKASQGSIAIAKVLNPVLQVQGRAMSRSAMAKREEGDEDVSLVSFWSSKRFEKVRYCETDRSVIRTVTSGDS